mgnify:CR=1 FL=1
MNIIKTISLDKKITINTFSLFLINATNFSLSIILLPRLIDSFGVIGWGEIILCQIIINYFIWIIDWSFPQYACKQISMYENQLKKRRAIFKTTRSSQFILFIISSVILIIYSIFFTKNEFAYLYSLLTLFGNYLQSYWYFEGREKIYESAIFQLTNKLIFTFFVFNVLTKGDDISLYFLYFGLANLTTGILSTLRIIFRYKEDIQIGNFGRSIKLIKKSFLLFNSSIIGNVSNSCIPYLIGTFSSLENLGLYNIADRIKNICIQIIHPLSNSIFPRMSKIYKNNKDIANKKFIFFTILILIISMLIFSFLNLNIDYIINYFVKGKSDSIKNILRILSISFIINTLYETFMNQYLVVNNLFKDVNKIKLIVLFSCILIGIPLIYFKGINGAALTNLAYSFIGLLCAVNLFIRTKNKKSLFY